MPGENETGAIAQVQLYVDGAHITSFDTTQFETKLGPIAAGDPRTFTMTETDPARNVSAHTYGLRALPPLAGLPVNDAIKALNASGFSAGTVTKQTSSDPIDTVLAPADVRVVPLGASVDLTVSGGPRPAGFTTLKLRALAPARFEPTRRRTILTSIDSTRPATATVSLSDARGHRLASWRKPLRAGLNHPRLLLSTSGPPDPDSSGPASIGSAGRPAHPQTERAPGNGSSLSPQGGRSARRVGQRSGISS